MNVQSKQLFAWLLAFGASSAIYGGGIAYLKKTAANAHLHHSDDHASAKADHDEGHGTSSEGSGHGHGLVDATVQGHHDSSHGDENGHETKESHQEKHGEEHSKAPSDHGKEPAKQKAEATHTTEHGDHKVTDKHAKSHAAAAHWSYAKDSKDGPKAWSRLTANFEQCEKGREQSPINLSGAVVRADAPKIQWSYHTTAVAVENNGHTIVANMPNDQNHVLIDGERYNLAQFHFHNPSEHKIEGIPSDMELHFVHKNSKGELAVIGVMLNEKAGEANASIKPLWDALPRDAHVKAAKTPAVNLASLLPVHRDYFNYAGSLTTPPCSQGVRWFVLKEPVAISGSQVDLYAGLFETPTNRPLQPQNGREIIQSPGPAAVAH